MCLFQFSLWSKITPKYLMSLSNCIGMLSITIGVSTVNFLFHVNKTKEVLSVDSCSSFRSHQSLIWLTMSCIREMRDGRLGPRVMVTRSSAKPCANSSDPMKFCNDLSRVSMTIFQSSGESIPPCGVPLIIYLSKVVPLREYIIFLLQRRLVIQFITVSGTFLAWSDLMMLLKEMLSKADLMSIKHPNANWPLLIASSIADTTL